MIPFSIWDLRIDTFVQGMVGGMFITRRVVCLVCGALSHCEVANSVYGMLSQWQAQYSVCYLSVKYAISVRSFLSQVAVC